MRSLLASAARQTIAIAAAGMAALPAMAERALSMSFEERRDYARIVMKWADGAEDGPGVTAEIVDQVLVIQFPEQITANLDSLTEALPSWATISRLDRDGRAIRVGLQRGGRVHVSRSADLTAVDLLLDEAQADPPDIVSPLIARRAREAEATRVAALPPPPPEVDLEIRGSHSGDTTRLAFYWPENVTFETIAKSSGETQLLFSHRARVDTAYLRVSPPANLQSFEEENTPKGYAFTVRSRDGLPIKAFASGQVVTVDISPSAEVASPEELIRDQLEQEGLLAAKAIPTEEVEGETLAPVSAEPKLVQTTPAPEPRQVEPAVRPPVSLLPASVTEPAVEAEEPDSASTGAIVGGEQRVTAMSEGWTDPAPPSGVTDVRVRPLTKGAELIVDFPEQAASAVFAAGGDIWAVFAANTDLRVDPADLPAGIHVRSLRSQDATYLRVDAPDTLSVSAIAEGNSWIIRLAPTARRPDRFLRAERRPGEGGRARIESEVEGAAGVVWIEDPLVGEEMAAIVAYGPSASHPNRFAAVEVAVPATAHGLVFIPRADDVTVQLDGETAFATISNRSQSAPEEHLAAGGGDSVNPAFVDFAAWGGLSGEDWFERRETLERAIGEAEPGSHKASVALLDLAKFYIGHDMAVEAIGVLQIASADRPDIELNAEYLGLAGAANVLAHRLTEAESFLSRGPLRNDPSAAVWRGTIAAERGDWERAVDFFRLAGKQPFAYAPEQAARFAGHHAEAAFHANDFETARREADIALANGEGVDAERGKLVLAMLASVIDGPQQGYAEFAELAETTSEPSAVRAELGRLELGVKAGRISASEAASELESLRYRWRGDDIEMRTVGILADQYMSVGRFREALVLAQATALRDPNAHGARELRIKLTDYFRQLFLDGKADRLDPIQSLALFYEFSELTPIGVDGDQMIRKLAQRLVAFDLLEPAAQLLQHQVDNRMRGVGKAALAVDLATIYLLDRRPDRALVAINSTRQPSIPRELAYERRKLEAAAYRDLGRYDHVIELMEPLEQPDARALLADAYLRKRDWASAADTYLSMLPSPQNASATDVELAYKGAIAARMEKSANKLARLRTYAPLFEGRAEKASFDLITAQADIEGKAISEAVRALADAPTVDAFAAAMKERFETGAQAGGSR